MAAIKLGGTTLALIIIAMALMVLVNPMINAAKAVVPNSAEPALADVWNEEINLAMQAVVVDPSYSHALEEHPDEAPIVWDCLASKGQYVAFQVDPGRRYLRVCLIDDETIGFQIVDFVGKKMMEKTAYIRDELKCVKDIFDYARRMGYARFTKPWF